MPTIPGKCDGHDAFKVGLFIGMWTYQLKKKLANGTVIILTQPKTVNVYNKYCDTLGVN